MVVFLLYFLLLVGPIYWRSLGADVQADEDQTTGESWAEFDSITEINNSLRHKTQYIQAINKSRKLFVLYVLTSLNEVQGQLELNYSSDNESHSS